MPKPVLRRLKAAGKPAVPAIHYLHVLHFLIVCIAALLAGCELDRPLIAPGDAYDPRLALVQDSLARFDTVEIRLVDQDDPSVSILLWKGPPGATDTLPLHLAGDGQTLVYLVHGYRIDRGQCFTERVSREGERSGRIDTCEVKPPDTGKDPKKDPLPKFQRDTLDFLKVDTVMSLYTFNVPDSGDGRYTLVPSVDWFLTVPDTFLAKGDRHISVRVNRSALKIGNHSGRLVLLADGKPLDTAYIGVEITKPVALIHGRVVDWTDSGGQSGFAIAVDGEAPKTFSDSNGLFDLSGLDPGSHVMTATSPGRIGSVDTFSVVAGHSLRTVYVGPSRAFAAVNLGWSHYAGRTAVAGGHGLVASADFRQHGKVAAFPLDNSSPSLQRFFPQGNSDGDPKFPEFFESGDVAADSQAIFIAYPDASRIGRIGNWLTAPETLSVAVPFHSGALLLHGSSLFALGRLPDSTLVLGEWNAADLSEIRMDYLTGFHWEGTFTDRCTPQMAVWNGSIYAVDGNGPGVKGRVLRIGLESRAVLDWKQVPDAMLGGLAIHEGMIYVTSMSSTGKTIRIFDSDLSENGAIDVGTGTGRIAFAAEGSMRGYGFVATDSNAILVIHPLAKQPLGTLSFPGSRPARSLSVDGRSGTVLVSDGDKLHSIRF